MGGDERLLMADSRSPASSSERQLWGKQTLKLETSAAIGGQEPTFRIETALAFLLSVLVPDVAMELPGMAAALPGNNVLSSDFGHTTVTGNA